MLTASTVFTEEDYEAENSACQVMLRSKMVMTSVSAYSVIWLTESHRWEQYWCIHYILLLLLFFRQCTWCQQREMMAQRACPWRCSVFSTSCSTATNLWVPRSSHALLGKHASYTVLWKAYAWVLVWECLWLEACLSCGVIYSVWHCLLPCGCADNKMCYCCA